MHIVLQVHGLSDSGTYEGGATVRTWKFHGNEMEGSSTGSGGCSSASGRSGVLGVFGRLPKLDSFRRPCLKPAGAAPLSGERTVDDAAGDVVRRLGVYDDDGDGVRIRVAY